MSIGKRLLIFIVILAGVTLLTALFAPFAVAEGLRLWLRWAARRDGMELVVGRIDAPFLKPVTIDSIKLSPLPGGHRVQLAATQVQLDLDFRGWIFARRARFLHALSIATLNGSIRQDQQAPARNALDWRNFERVLPDEFRFGEMNLEVVTRTTTFRFRGVTLSASEVEAGKFFAQQVAIVSPLLRQSFHNLRGATSWEENRLTLAGLSLVPGLDLQALTVDLASLTKKRVGLEVDLDAFGGTLRASFQGQGGGKKFAVDLAGSASDVSLAQISRAAGFLEPLNGVVRASKFTFRGNPGEFLDATASVWIELRDFAWRARRAQSVVFGATFYDRRLQIEQLYVRQERNELTVNGELLWPRKPIRWAGLQFRGQLTATIPDANSFAQLFGVGAGDFSGALSASGELNSMDPGAEGKLSLRGNEVRFRGVALDSLGATFLLHDAEATLKNLEVRHGDDFLRAHGSADLRAPHAYSARVTGAVNDLGAYAPLLPKSWRSSAISGGATFDWSGDGTAAAHSGTVQFFAHGLRLPIAPLRSPLDITLEGTYSPASVFFRTCKLASEHLSLGGFVLLGSNFIELQALNLALDGETRASGTLFLPIGVDRWRKSGELLAAIDEQQKFDLDLEVNQLDLAAFARALGERVSWSGLLQGKLAAYGPLASLQLTTDWHLKNLAPAAAPNTIDLDLHYDDDRAEAKMSGLFGVSSPLLGRLSLPLRLTKSNLAEGSVIDASAPFSAELHFPALLLESLPERLQPFALRSGILSGEVNWSGSWRAPQITGTAQLNAGRIAAPPFPLLDDISARFAFADDSANLAALRFHVGDFALAGRGRLTLRPPAFSLTLFPENPELAVALMPESGGFISAARVLGAAGARQAPRLDSVRFDGAFGSRAFSLTTATAKEERSFFFDPAASTQAAPLLFEVAAPAPASPLSLGSQR